MISIFFVPGTFGTTAEYVIRNHTKEYTKINAEILSDGSMHSFKKEHHPISNESLQQLPSNLNDQFISTPIYPFRDLKLPDIINHYTRNNVISNRILLYCNSLSDAELNCLFQYYKICCGLNLGLGIFFDGATDSAQQWNSAYLSWQDMQHWELREWFSLLYPQWVTEWINSTHEVTGDWLKIANSEILSAPAAAFLKIIDFCNLTPDGDISAFASHWLEKQQYVLDEFDLLDRIISSTLANQDLNWKPLNLISEAIIQQRLRALNFELMCDGLNIFPTTSEQLNKILIKV